MIITSQSFPSSASCTQHRVGFIDHHHHGPLAECVELQAKDPAAAVRGEHVPACNRESSTFEESYLPLGPTHLLQATSSLWQHRRGQIWGKRRSTSPGARQRSPVWFGRPCPCHPPWDPLPGRGAPPRTSTTRAAPPPPSPATWRRDTGHTCRGSPHPPSHLPYLALPASII